LQRTVLESFNHNVATSIEITVNVDLRERGPHTVLLHTDPKLLAVEYIHRLEFGSAAVEDLDNSVGETALGKHLRALHENNNLVGRHKLVDGRLEGTV